MGNIIIENLQGKEIEVLELRLTAEELTPTLYMKTILDGRLITVVFHNVSNLSINDLSYPFQICGFEILDNKSKGWQSSSRYTVNDFEDGKISLLCENITVL